MGINWDLQIRGFSQMKIRKLGNESWLFVVIHE
jgi:hypothetical protein